MTLNMGVGGGGEKYAVKRAAISLGVVLNIKMISYEV